MTPVLVTVLLNAERDSMLHGYSQGDRLLPVWRELITLDQGVTFEQEAERYFAKFNHDDRPGGMAHRSMSVGDVVLFESPGQKMALSVESLGFKPINVGLVIQHAVVQ